MYMYYIPTIRASKYIKQKMIEFKTEVNNSRIIVCDFKNTCSIMVRQTRNILARTEGFDSTIYQLDVRDSLRTRHQIRI